MIYDEQQINNSLKNIDLQQQCNHIHWQLPKNHNNYIKSNKFGEGDITQWATDRQEIPSCRKQKVFTFLNHKNKVNRKESSYLLKILNQLEQIKGFSPQRIIHYRSEDKVITPNKINLKLSLPKKIEQANSSMFVQRKSSLPFIKRASKMKNMEKKMEQSEDFSLVNQRGNIFLNKMGENRPTKLNRKGQMMGITHRARGFHSSTPKISGSSLPNKALRECITFMK